MAQKKKNKGEGFEDRLKRLSAIVDDLERGELPLEEGVALFKEGLAISRTCAQQLESARNEIELAGGGELPDLDGQDMDREE